jgi:transglutaminase-like putative cysteine protease
MKRDFSAFFLYIFGFLLLWEWLRPVGQLTDTAHISTFVVFILISFLMSFFNIKRFWQFIIKGIYILFTINQFHYHVSFFHLSWMKSFILHLKNSIYLLFERNWNGLPFDFRTLLFFILLWIMTYLIQYWLLKRMRIFIFFFLTLIYITVLDTFTDYDAKVAIVRTVITGFAVMGLLTFYRITKREHIDQESSYFRKWVVPLCGMIALSVFAGIITPKAAPIWPDPVPYLKGENTKANASAGTGKGIGPARVGYGTNDTELGGPFIADDGRVFLYEAANEFYWKVETKDIYTGKGWIPSGSTPVGARQGDLVPLSSIPSVVPTTKETAKVLLAKDASFIGYPEGLQKILNVNPKPPESEIFDIDTTIEKIIPHVAIFQYTVDFLKPKYNDKDLTKASGPDLSVMSQADYQRYTQLPQNLPARIKQLTEKITAKETNWFDKAKAVERYFGNSEFTYDQKNVPYPTNAQDYVDQFLFTSKRGYCDNFSSSMAVMLRTIGIPTRWVKGFTGGDFLQYGNDNSTQLYEVTNNNAHAWVEVFIPTQGWVPFEPTKGFSNQIAINYTSNSTSTNTQQPAPAPLKKPQMDPRENIGEKKVKSTTAEKGKSIWTGIKAFWKNNWKLAILYLIILLAVICYLYRIRGKWLPYLLLIRYRFKKKDENIGNAYLLLLNQLDRYGLKRKENQTLRNYAKYVDSFFSTREMTSLTMLYEQYVYHQELQQGTWKESQKLWENLIKKTIA